MQPSGLHCAAVTGLGGGAKTVWTMGRFEPLRVLELIQDEKVTGWGYTATMLHRVVHHPRARKFDLSSLRMMGGGGSPIPAPLQEQALTLVQQYFGRIPQGKPVPRDIPKEPKPTAERRFTVEQPWPLPAVVVGYPITNLSLIHI